jgi:hypothetical protein
VRAVPRLCKFYSGICLTTEEKARKNPSLGKKNLSQVKNLSQSTVYIHTLQNPHKHTHYKTHTNTHITKPYTHAHAHTHCKTIWPTEGLSGHIQTKQDKKLHIMQFSSSSGYFLDRRQENPPKSPEITFFPNDNDAVCTPTQNICKCYNFTYFIIFILEEDTTGNTRAVCESWYEVTCVLISITCATDRTCP